MEKIFDSDFRATLIDSLKEAGIDDEKASSIIHERYKTALRRAVISRLRYMAILIEKGKYEEVSKFISYSPAGDCMGCENHYFNFSDICDRTDIGDVLMGLEPSIKLPSIFD